MFELLRIYKETGKEKLKSVKGNLYVFFRWSLIAILVGIRSEERRVGKEC